jgi:8-oxo-dGTP diphosphatase
LRRFAPLALLPRHALGLLREVARHLLRRPVVAICAVATTADGRILLVRRGDSGEWALPGGTLEWGERLRDALPRELEEEAGVRCLALGRVTGVYSRPDRDPRFHAVTVCVAARIADDVRGPHNPLEIREARLFPPGALPDDVAPGMCDMIADAARGGETVLE